MTISRRKLTYLTAGIIVTRAHPFTVAARVSTDLPKLTVIHQLYTELWNGKDLDVANEIFATDHVYHDPDTPGIGIGPAGYQDLVRLYSGLAPDLHFTINDLVVEGEQVAVRWTAAGTFTGVFGDIPGNGNPVAVLATAIYRFDGEKIAETWVVFDILGLLAQIGAAPPAHSNPVATPQAAFASPPFGSSELVTAAIKTQAAEFYERVWNAQEISAVPEFVTDDYQYFDPAVAPLPPGPDGYAALVSSFVTAIPDLTITITNSLSDGITIAVHWIATGTQTGELLSVPATGRSVSVEAISFLTYREGKIAFNWSVFDAYGLVAQLTSELPAAATPVP